MENVQEYPHTDHIPSAGYYPDHECVIELERMADGGETSMANPVQICRVHNRLVHEAGYGVQIVAGEGIVFSLPDGKIIPGGPDTRSRGNVLAIKSGNRENALDINPGTSIPEWYGDQMDHGMAVDMRLQCE